MFDAAGGALGVETHPGVVGRGEAVGQAVDGCEVGYWRGLVAVMSAPASTTWRAKNFDYIQQINF